VLRLVVLGVSAIACSDAPPATSTANGTSTKGLQGASSSSSQSLSSSGAASNPVTVRMTGNDGGSPATACSLAKALRGGSCHFLVGMGSDLNPSGNHSMDGAYTLGTTLDLHYVYLVDLPTMGGWPDWNSPSGDFVNIMTDAADAAGVTPMFTLYAMASEGDGNLGMLTDTSAMNLYWQGAKLLFQRLALYGKPAVVHLEPDFWGYAMQKTLDGTADVLVTEYATDCAGLPDNLIGMAGCLVRLARMYAPNALIGFHASAWGGTQAQVIQFFQTIHADATDFIVTDVLDRDAGCYEAATDPVCMGKQSEALYWDETNQTSPNFAEHLAWVTAVHQGLGNLPVVWWQLPFGVPSTTPGGTTGHYRDDRVHYFFSHVDEFVAAGGLGAVFGTGASDQTDWTTDGDEFKNDVAAYFASPTPL
jgi:hypothetical protein